MKFLGFIGQIFEPLAKLVDNVHTSEEERLEIKKNLYSIEAELAGRMIEYETKLLQSKSEIIVAETKSDSWITRSWRPIVMLTFTGIVVMTWLGYQPENVAPEVLDDVFFVIKLGLGGYLGGRSLEKIASKVPSMMRKD